MSIKPKKATNTFQFEVEDFILYILNHLEPDKSDKIRLNKIAFFTEFAYIYFNHKPLSKVTYAAIDKGAVIDGYDLILKRMSKEGKIKIDGYFVRPLTDPKVNIPKEVASFTEPLIKKYSIFTNDELIGLSHNTDSYKITTSNEKRMGKIIDKDLALLETFFDNSITNEDYTCKVRDLPAFDRNKLVRYEFSSKL